MIHFYNRLRQVLFCFVFFASLAAFGQDQTRITGKVLDADTQSPLPGATVLVVGTTNGTVADSEGSFALNVPTGQPVRIEVSFIGYATATTEVPAGSTAPLTISLRGDMLSLDEVVVIGSTVKQEKRSLGNTITSIKASQITNRGTGDIIQSMQGKIAGAQITQNSGDPAGGVSVKLRGAKSVLSSSEPLYVIDGVIVSNATRNVTNVNVDAGPTAAIGQNRMADINPNDIESIEVINGAAAAAIYGSRAGNGVVLITTKRGQSGKPDVSFSTSFGINELRKRVYMTTYPKQFGTPTFRLNTIGDSNSGIPGTQLYTNLVDVERFDYQDQIFRTGYSTDNNISVTGGSDNTKYFASASYLYNQGIIENADFRRYGARLRLDQKINNWLTASVGLNYTNSFSNEKPNGNVFWSPINSIMITNNIYKIWERDAFGNLKAAEPTRINPLSGIETFDITQETNRTIADLQFTATPVEGLTISYLLGIDNINQTGNIYIPPYPYTGVNPGFYDDGYASSAVATTFLMNNDLNLSYQKKLGTDFSLLSQAGFSHQYNKDIYTNAQGRKLAPFIRTVNGASTMLPPSNTKGIFEIFGVYLSETLSFKNQLYLTLAGRIDGSTSFSEDNRRQFYPKASLSYIVTDTDWWSGLGVSNTISQLKLRTSYGQAGNLTGIGPYDRFYQYTPNSYLGSISLNAGNALANEDVKPERQTEIEVGADIALLANRVNIGFTWYNQEIEDLLIDRALAPSEGGTNIRTNIGTLENKGIEISVNATPVKTEKFAWNVYGTFSRNRNKATNIGQARIALTNLTGAPPSIVAGEPIGVFYGTYYARNDNGDLLLNAAGHPLTELGTQNTVLEGTPSRDGAGLPTGSVLRKVIGNPNPDFIWSFGSSLEYKNFTLGFLLDAVYGNEVFNADKRTRQGVGIGDYAEKEYKGELPRGYILAIYNIEEFRIDDGSFVKIREVSLNYRFPFQLKGIRNLQATLTGRNLYSFDNYNGYDPETNAAGQSSAMRGIDFGNVPIPRSYQLSLRANF